MCVCALTIESVKLTAKYFGTKKSSAVAEQKRERLLAHLRPTHSSNTRGERTRKYIIFATATNADGWASFLCSLRWCAHTFSIPVERIAPKTRAALFNSIRLLIFCIREVPVAHASTASQAAASSSLSIVADCQCLNKVYGHTHTNSHTNMRGSCAALSRTRSRALSETQSGGTCGTWMHHMQMPARQVDRACAHKRAHAQKLVTAQSHS